MTPREHHDKIHDLLLTLWDRAKDCPNSYIKKDWMDLQNEIRDLWLSMGGK